MSVALKHLEDLLRFNATRNVRLNDQVNELRKRDRDVWFHVVPGVSGFLCLGRLFQGQPNEAALCI